MTASYSARIRGIIHQLRTQKEFTRLQRVEISNELESIARSYPELLDRIKAVLRGFKKSLMVQPSGNYYVVDSDYFIAAADLLQTIPDEI